MSITLFVPPQSNYETWCWNSVEHGKRYDAIVAEHQPRWTACIKDPVEEERYRQQLKELDDAYYPGVSEGEWPRVLGGMIANEWKTITVSNSGIFGILADLGIEYNGRGYIKSLKCKELLKRVTHPDLKELLEAAVEQESALFW